MYIYVLASRGRVTKATDLEFWVVISRLASETSGLDSLNNFDETTVLSARFFASLISYSYRLSTCEEGLTKAISEFCYLLKKTMIGKPGTTNDTL